jgi:hypothetical protein
MNKGEILVEIHEMRGEYARASDEALKRIGKASLNDGVFPIILNNSHLSKIYYTAQAKVFVLDELLEKIAKTPDDSGEVKGTN